MRHTTSETTHAFLSDAQDAYDAYSVHPYALPDDINGAPVLHHLQSVHHVQAHEMYEEHIAHERPELTDARAIFRAWRLGEVLAVALPATGAIHRTLLLTTTTGPYVVRGYRHAERAPVEREHALIAHMQAQGIPAPAPLAMPDGETILEYNGGYYALFPFARGVHVLRTQLSPRGAATMGAFLGKLHRALADVPHDDARRRDLRVDTSEAIQEAIELEAIMRQHPLRDEVDRRAFARLLSQRQWLERQSEDARAQAEGARRALFALPTQLIHGDYQDTNLFFEDETERAISAILDWDPAYIAPRAFEVIRTLDIVFNLEPARCQAFIAAYRASYRQAQAESLAPIATYAHEYRAAEATHRRGWIPLELALRWGTHNVGAIQPVHLATSAYGPTTTDPLPLEELDLAAAVYSWTRAHGFWIYWEVYRHGNNRVRRFIGPAEFIPFIEGWRMMRHYLRHF